jgi:hypothetical protein
MRWTPLPKLLNKKVDEGGGMREKRDREKERRTPLRGANLRENNNITTEKSEPAAAA